MAFNSLFLPLIVFAGRNKGLSNQQLLLPAVAGLMMPSPMVGLALALGISQNEQQPAPPLPILSSTGSQTTLAVAPPPAAFTVHFTPSFHGLEKHYAEDLARVLGFTVHLEGDHAGKVDWQEPGIGKPIHEDKIVKLRFK